MIKGHGGNIYDLAQTLGCAPSEIIDMSSNVNPLGPPPGLSDVLKKHICSINALPEVDAEHAVSAFADRYGVNPEHVLAGNGTTQFIYTIPPALGTKNACIVGPTYSDYGDACVMHNVPHTYLISQETHEFQPDIDQIEKAADSCDTLFICNPNNPTGALVPRDHLESLCRSHPNTRFVIDESYLPFVSKGEEQSLLNLSLPNVMVLNSMSKIFRVPGLRIGFLVASGSIIERFSRYALPWSVNSLAQAAVIYLMTQKSETDAFVEKTRQFLEQERQRFSETLRHAPGIRTFPSLTSFVLARLLHDHTADNICGHLAQDGILIRNCANFKGLSDRFIRISLKKQNINNMIAEKLLAL